jgi:hypothetical protein
MRARWVPVFAVVAVAALAASGVLLVVGAPPLSRSPVPQPPGASRICVDIPHPTAYTVRFLATGLHGAYNWSVTLGNSSAYSSTSTEIAFQGVVNGTYAYRIAAAGEVAAPSFGSVTVRGADVNQSVAFSPAPGAAGSTNSGPSARWRRSSVA